MKEQDKSLLKQFIELRASILQLRCLYDPDLHGSCSDVSSVGSGSTYSLNEPAGAGMAYSNSISSNINKIHINSSSNCNVLKSPHQLRRMLLMGGVNPSALTHLASANFPDLYTVSVVSARGAGNLTAAFQTSAHPTTISKSILKKWPTRLLARIGMAEDRKREIAQFGIDLDQVLKKIRRIERSLEDDSDDL
ncbi:hypothetical protein ElyMa_001569300 [Elysia marginata]|uniref:Uncharacterized protein n=1 Tax=Elysia marginata TaxID=1093978 RepID=A0AAV4JHC9_9GAST|nr:hypothetical protein ElyMa_001569300 [Elysia marginata]